MGPTIAILNLPEYKCPDASAMVNVTDPLTNISSLGKQKAQDSISSVSKKIGGRVLFDYTKGIYLFSFNHLYKCCVVILFYISDGRPPQ